MEMTKKTTILFPPDLHAHLVRVAAQRKTSLGALVREACEREYGMRSAAERLDAVQALAQMDLPVGTPEQMAAESVPTPDALTP